MDLSLPHKLVSIEEVLPKILAAIEGLDQNLAADYAMSAAIEFAKATHCMRKTICIDVLPCITSYSLDVEPFRLFEVMTVVHDTSGDLCLSNKDLAPSVYIEGNTLYLNEEPSEQMRGSKLIVEVALVPKRSGSHISEDMYEDWEPAIVALALSNLYLVNAEWGDKGLADRYMQSFSTYLERARFHNTSKHKPFSMRLTPKWSTLK